MKNITVKCLAEELDIHVGVAERALASLVAKGLVTVTDETRRSHDGVNNAFVLYWRHGGKETVHGTTISEAFTAAGYGAGAMSALDFYDALENDHEWVYDKESHNWITNKL